MSIPAPHHIMTFYKVGANPTDPIRDALKLLVENDSDLQRQAEIAELLAQISIPVVGGTAPPGIPEIELIYRNPRGGPMALLLANWRDWPSSDTTPFVDVLSDGRPFTTGGKRPDRAESTVTKLFVELCDAIAPTYAASTVEWYLETPSELLEDPRSYAFNDFFIGHELGQESIGQISEIMKGADRLQLQAGILFKSLKYMSTGPPEGGDSSRSGAVARLLGKRLASMARSRQWLDCASEPDST